MTEQPYQTPQSDVRPETHSGGKYGSVENAITGNYELEIGAIVKEAWAKTKGIKGTIIAAIAVIYAIVFAGTFLAEMIMPDDVTFSVIVQIITTIIVLPMEIGLFIIGIRRSIDQPVSFSMIFNYAGYLLPLLLAMLLMYLLVTIGLVLLVIPGIYLAVSYAYAFPLIVEKKMGVWTALETSRKAVTKRWFSIVGLWIVLFLIVLVSVIPAGLGLVWSFPMAIVANGIVYRNMFGVEPIQA